MLILIIGIASCKKAEDPPIQYPPTNLNASLKSDFVFSEGDYWVYQNQALNEDSIILLSVDSSFTSSGPSCCPVSPEENFTLQYNSVSTGNSFNHYLIRNYIKYNGGGENGELGQPIFIVDKTEGYSFNGLTVAATLDSLEVDETVFLDVIEMHIDADSQHQQEFDFDTELYFVPSIGVVKKVIHDSVNGTQTWELIRWSAQ